MKISIQGLCFGYKQRQVLRGVDLEVPSGSLCALLGANGAGKTTLLKCINGILRPQSGRVFADDTDLGSLTARERARLIGYVPQNAQAGGSCLNVLETVLSGRVPHRKGRLKSEDYDIAGQVLESMDLSRYAMRQLNQLSGGERSGCLSPGRWPSAPGSCCWTSPPATWICASSRRPWRSSRRSAPAGASR